jgi:hypothetical protein
MSTLDEITKEKQRVSEALARVDAQREKLTSQLRECLNKGLRADARHWNCSGSGSVEAAMPFIDVTSVAPATYGG